MMTETSTVRPTRQPSLGLHDLAQLGSGELDALYRGARASSSMHAADGALTGRLLAVRGVPAALGGALRRWAASPRFVWEGKTFRADSDARGVGHNRVYLPGVFGRQDLFPFATSFGPSAIDGKPTLVLDYDLDANPAYIRRIHDEIREVSPGVFLGPAMWKRGASKALVLWFALDATRVAERPS